MNCSMNGKDSGLNSATWNIFRRLQTPASIHIEVLINVSWQFFFLFNIFTEHPQCSSWYLKFVLFVICIFFLIITKCLLNYPSGDRDWYCSALALFSSKTSLHSCNAKKIIAFIQGGPSTLSRSREEFLHSSKTNTTVYSVHHFLCSSDIKSDQNIVYVFIFKNILVPYINLKKKTHPNVVLNDDLFPLLLSIYPTAQSCHVPFISIFSSVLKKKPTHLVDFL